MSLAAKSLNAVKSNYLGTIIRIFAQFVAQIVIMRELGPELIGIFGYALLLNGLLALVIDQGFGWSLIQGDFNDRDEIAVVFSRILLLSFVAMMAVFIISYSVEDYLENDLVGAVFRYSAPSYLLIGFFAITQAKLRAELRFREIQTAITGAYIIAYPIVGVAMAMTGWGVWSLVVAWYVQGVLQVIIGHYYAPHSLRLANPFRPTKSGPLGRQVAGINVLNWGVDNTSGVFVGGMGASSLGNFNAASMLARTPVLHIVHALQTILFSTASAIGDDQRRIKHLYLGALAAVGIVVFPAYGYAATHADFIVKLLFGDQWLHASGIFSALAIGMIALAAGTLSGAILTATGDQKTVIYSQLVCLVLMIAGLWISINISLIYVGMTITAAYTVRLMMQLKTISVRCGITLGELSVAVRGPLIAAALMALPVSFFWEFPFERISIELFAILVKFFTLLLLIKIFPRLLICSALVYVLVRFDKGRRMVGFLGL